MFLNAILFPLRSAMDNRWNRYCVSKGFNVTSVTLLPSSAINSDASEFQGPAVSIAIWMKCCVVARLLYFAILFVAAFALRLHSQQFRQCEMRHMYRERWRPMQWAFHVSREWEMLRLASFHGIVRDQLVAEIWALFTALQIRSLSVDYLMCHGPLFRHDSPWSPLALTIAPQMHTCCWHVMQPSLSPTATRIALSERRRPIAVSGGAFSQSSACGAS